MSTYWAPEKVSAAALLPATVTGDPSPGTERKATGASAVPVDLMVTGA
jgi:hypothetical protein